MKITDPDKVPQINDDNFMKRVLNLTFVHDYMLRKDSTFILKVKLEFYFANTRVLYF